MPSDEEIQEQIDAASDHDRSLWRGMTYEDGVMAALRWVLGDEDQPPMAEDE